LNRFNSNFNGKSLTQQQSAILADIVKNIHTKLEDVVLMLKQARQGIMATVKTINDGQNVLTKWFPEYLEKNTLNLSVLKNKK
jgi:hypothetical protein